MIKEELLVHIGYQKTGTTWLQSNFFSNSDAGFFMPFERKRLLELLIFPHPFDFEPQPSWTYFASTLAPYQDNGLFPVLSYERLSGLPDCGDYESKDTANRIASIFQRPKILIVIREQVDMILSTYNQYVKKGGVVSLKKYLNQNRSYPTGQKGFDIARYRYHRLIAYYIKLFGKENVLTLAYEEFKSSPQSFTQKIIDFCNLDLPTETLPYNVLSNQSQSQLAVKIASKINRIVCKRDVPTNPSPFFSMGKRRYKKGIRLLSKVINGCLTTPYKARSITKAKEQIRAKVRGYYCESNQITTELTGLPLEEYGYMI